MVREKLMGNLGVRVALIAAGGFEEI